MSKNSSRVYPTGLILKIIEENESDHIGTTALAKKYGIKVCTVKYWLKDYRRNGMMLFNEKHVEQREKWNVKKLYCHLKRLIQKRF